MCASSLESIGEGGLTCCLSFFGGVPMNRCLPILGILACVVACAAGSARADSFTLYQSALIGPTGIDAGWEVSSLQFVGVRFEVFTNVTTSLVGGHLFETQFQPLGNHQIFGTIVALSGPDDLPDSFDLSTPDVLGTTLLTLPPLSADVAAPLSIQLTPGWYSLIFGSGSFGATGHGALAAYNTEIGTPSTFTLNQYVYAPSGLRFFVEAVPEPSSASILGIWLTAPLFVRPLKKRRKKPKREEIGDGNPFIIPT
jgi:hypothetical protein